MVTLFVEFETTKDGIYFIENLPDRSKRQVGERGTITWQDPSKELVDIVTRQLIHGDIVLKAELIKK